MKNLGISVFLCLFLLLVGCGSQANWEAKLHSAVFANEQSVPLSLSIMDGNNPVTGLQVKAIVVMKKMDHGTVEVPLQENERGVYSATIALPMRGVWIADLVMEKDGEYKEQSLEFTVEGEEK